VDDLTDIGELETYVAKSMSMLFFLSKGYMQSRNCLREIRVSLALKKPIILVHEADEARGGAPLRYFMDQECSPDLHDAIFRDREVTEWHRIKAFQMASLKAICVHVLRVSPVYSKATGSNILSAKDLVLPGDVDPAQLKFPSHVTLHCSKDNPGALAAAMELQAVFPTSIFIVGQQRQIIVGQQRQITERRALMRSTMAALPSPEQPLQSPGSDGVDEETASVHDVVFFLYLCASTFRGEEGARLMEELAEALAQKKQILLVHEKDAERQGCEFGTFFGVVSGNLVDAGIFKSLATPLVAGDGPRSVSYGMLAVALGASKAASLKVAEVTKTMIAGATTTLTTASSTGRVAIVSATASPKKKISDV
jgi:hypothetical protein